MSSETEMKNARLGVAYLWQGTSHQSPLINTIVSGMLGSAGALAGVREINLPLPDQTTDVLQIGIESGIESGPKATVWRTVKEWATTFVAKLWEKIKSIFGDVSEMAVHLKKISLFVAQQVYAQAAPFIGGTSTLVSGLWKTTGAFVEKLGLWVASRTVTMNYGHPRTLVEGIEAGLNRSMLDGIYDIARSSLSIGVNALEFGGAAGLDAVAAIIDAAVKILWRYAESRTITQFCQSAKQVWQSRGATKGVISRANRFQKWLRRGTEAAPIIAAVTVGSGVAGDKMRFLQMYADNGAIITQSQFNEGVSYLEGLKRTAARLIERSEIDFTSQDQIIDGLLKLAKSHNTTASSTSTGWWGFFGLDKVFRS